MRLNSCNIQDLENRVGGWIVSGGLGLLENLDLGGNKIQTLSDVFCDDVARRSKLVNLNLSNNEIGGGGGGGGGGVGGVGVVGVGGGIC